MNSKLQQFSLFLLRISLGWIFFYSGITKILNPNFTAAGYLKNAQTLKPLFDFFAGPEMIGITNILNSYGQFFIGIALILGVFLRPAGIFGIMLMILYYLPILHFPYVGKNPASFIIDEHVIYSLVFLVLISFDAGKYWGLNKNLSKLVPGQFKKYL